MGDDRLMVAKGGEKAANGDELAGWKQHLEGQITQYSSEHKQLGSNPNRGTSIKCKKMRFLKDELGKGVDDGCVTWEWNWGQKRKRRRVR